MTKRKLRKLIHECLLEEDVFSSIKSDISSSRFGYEISDIDDFITRVFDEYLKYDDIVVSAYNRFELDQPLEVVGAMFMDHIEAEDELTFAYTIVKQQTFGPGQVGFQAFVDIVRQIEHLNLTDFIKTPDDRLYLNGVKEWVDDKVNSRWKGSVDEFKAWSLESLEKLSPDFSIAISVAFLSLSGISIERYIGASKGMSGEREDRYQFLMRFYQQAFIEGIHRTGKLPEDLEEAMNMKNPFNRVNAVLGVLGFFAGENPAQKPKFDGPYPGMVPIDMEKYRLALPPESAN